MNHPHDPNCPRNAARRALLGNLAAALSYAALAPARGAEAGAPPAAELLLEADPAATAVHYVENADRAKDAQPGANCSNCILYKDTPGGGQGQCKLFPGKLVKTAGWCSSWSDL
jgi:hypothetical protein